MYIYPRIIEWKGDIHSVQSCWLNPCCVGVCVMYVRGSEKEESLLAHLCTTLLSLYFQGRAAAVFPLLLIVWVFVCVMERAVNVCA